MNWVKIYNQLWAIMNSKGETYYYSGEKFISIVREINQDFPDYKTYIAQRQSEGKSTSRKDYYYDILFSFESGHRIKIINRILNSVEHSVPSLVTDIRHLMQDEVAVPIAEIAEELWNSDRLNKYLNEIDECIVAGNYERAVTLSYTCLEGFYKSFAKQKIKDGDKIKPEIITLSKAIQNYLKLNLKEYPNEAITMINHISHTVDKTRNGFSESHLGVEADSWISVYIRDLVNSQIRLLLHFIS